MVLERIEDENVEKDREMLSKSNVWCTALR